MTALLRKHWHEAVLFIGCSTLGLIYAQHMIAVAAGVLVIVNAYCSWLLRSQGRLLARQHDILVEATACVMQNATELECAALNLRRACAELERHGIPFAIVRPEPRNPQELS